MLNTIGKITKVIPLSLLWFALLSTPSLISALEVNKDGIEPVALDTLSTKTNLPNIHPSGHDLSDIDLENDQHDIQVYDPLEEFNRPIYEFNKGLDYVLLEPIATVYHEVTPSWGKERVSTFLSNLHEPINCINGILQGDGDVVANAVGRFLTNTLLGLGGLFDVAATQPDLQIKDTDFGLTLKKYGADLGFYLVLPVLGPSSARDATGKAFDFGLDPFNYRWVKNKYRNARLIAITITTREKLLEPIKTIRETSLDEYSAIRSIYWQKRK